MGSKVTARKNLSYIAPAVALGVVLMLATFWLFPSEAGNRDVPSQWSTPLAERAQELKGFYQPVASPRVDLTSVSLMLVLGVVCALGVTLYFKKRIV